MPQKIVIAGGAGFIGQALGRRWRERGHEVVLLTRHEARRRGDGLKEVPWTVRAEGSWLAELEGAAAVVNLAGRSVNCVHTAANRREILESRLQSVAALGEALRTCRQPPSVWVQASAVGYYGSDHSARRCDETTPAGTDYLADVCRQWEEAADRACPEGVRQVSLRLGLVLGRRGGAFPRLLRLAERFLGGQAGSGRQGMSWVHVADVEEIFLRAVADATMTGAYNVAAPTPASNREFMRALRRAAGRPWCPPAPSPIVWLAGYLVMRVDPSLVLRGQYVMPRRLLEAGYEFKFSRLVAALDQLADANR